MSMTTEEMAKAQGALDGARIKIGKPKEYAKNMAEKEYGIAYQRMVKGGQRVQLRARFRPNA